MNLVPILAPELTCKMCIYYWDTICKRFPYAHGEPISVFPSRRACGEFKPGHEVAVIVGRFSPLHNGHCYIIEKAFERFNDAIIVVGSANDLTKSNRTYNNHKPDPKTPFSTTQRVDFIKKAYPYLNVQCIEDVYDLEKWLYRLDDIISATTTKTPVFIEGRSGESKYYRDIPRKDGLCRKVFSFGEWEDEVSKKRISATRIRGLLEVGYSISGMVPPEIVEDITRAWKRIQKDGLNATQ